MYTAKCAYDTMICLHPRIFYLYISLQNCFVSYDYNTYVGRGLVLDWLDHQNFVQQAQNDVNFRTLVIDIGKRSTPSFGSSIDLLFGAINGLIISII